MKTGQALLAIGLGWSIAGNAQATSRTFQQNTETSTGSGVYAWNNAANWSPSAVPGASDFATIPNASTCMVLDSATAECEKLTINSGGTLVLGQVGGGSAQIEIGDNDEMTPAESITVNGTFVVDDSNAVIIVGKGYPIGGSSTIETRASTDGGDTDPGGKVSIFPHLAGAPGAAISIGGTLTLRGSITFHTQMDVGSGVYVYCDEVWHKMFFGPANNWDYNIDFDGTLYVGAGECLAQRMRWGNSAGAINVAGGLFKLKGHCVLFSGGTCVTEFASQMTGTSLNFTVLGGIAEFERSVVAANLQLVGTGVIKVAANRSAEFN